MSKPGSKSAPAEAVRREVRVDKRDLRKAEIVELAPAPLPEGSARLRLDLFGLTANNITYADMGEGFAGYWDFFPAADGGRVPVWGFGTVVESKAAGVDEGARCFGYYPMAHTVDVVPAKVSERGFMDGAPVRLFVRLPAMILLPPGGTRILSTAGSTSRSISHWMLRLCRATRPVAASSM